jgi:hypothetical protein
MQNRVYAVLILVIIGICCLGLYVAVSGFLNSNPPSFIANTLRTPPAFTPFNVVIPTDPPAPKSATVAINPTNAPPAFPLPLQTLTVPNATASSPTATSRPAAPQPTSPSTQSCGNFQFCNASGPPDPSLMSGASGCPSDYIWGRVWDLSGKGIPEKKIRYRNPGNETLGPVSTKNQPDVPGKYDIPTGPPGSSWALWIQADDGSQVSPLVSITTKIYPGGGDCPNRIDFKQQR